MKERPILFSTSMVQAILEGRKTMTRRFVKPQPNKHHNIAEITESFSRRTERKFHVLTYYANTVSTIKCPYGTIGDRLWVRETFRVTKTDVAVDYKADYQSDGTGKTLPRTWKPSIFMPRAASRITLEITNVRVERLQEITEEDAKNEGVMSNEDFPSFDINYKLCPDCGGQVVHGALGENLGVTEVDCSTCDTYKKRFMFLWESINGKDSWNENPWVWVVEFKRV